MQYLDIIHVKGDFYSVVFRDSDTDGSMRALEIKNGFVVFVDTTIYKFDNNANLKSCEKVKMPVRKITVKNKIIL